MFRTVVPLLLLALVACKHQNHSAPILAPVNSRVVAVGETLQFTLGATDNDSDTLYFATEGDVGPDADPYVAGNPATFDTASGTFSWAPSDAEIGNYSVEFSVSDAELEAPDDSETITIMVVPLAEYGRAFFKLNCAACHGEGALGATAVGIRGKDRVAIETALATIPAMGTLQDQVSTTDLERVADYLDYTFSLGTHVDFSNTQTCVTCHDNDPTQGKGPSHLNTTDDCAACHVLLDWMSAIVDHRFVQGTCESCHNGSTAGLAKPEGHARTTGQCEACHSTDSFKPVVWVDHGQVQQTGCADCHSLRI